MKVLCHTIYLRQKIWFFGVWVLFDRRFCNGDYLRKNKYYPECKPEELTSNIIKMTYLDLLESDIVQEYIDKKYKIYPSSILITTNDAITLTEGPTIYLAKDIEKNIKDTTYGILKRYC